MERNTCYLNLSVAEAARTVSELVERAGRVQPDGGIAMSCARARISVAWCCFL